MGESVKWSRQMEPRLGGPGRLLGRGSRGPVRAHISAYGSSDRGFIAWAVTCATHALDVRIGELLADTVTLIRLRASKHPAYFPMPIPRSGVRLPSDGSSSRMTIPASQVLPGR